MPYYATSEKSTMANTLFVAAVAVWAVIFLLEVI
jgi:hypothetical protein